MLLSALKDYFNILGFMCFNFHVDNEMRSYHSYFCKVKMKVQVLFLQSKTKSYIVYSDIKHRKAVNIHTREATKRYFWGIFA